MSESGEEPLPTVTVVVATYNYSAVLPFSVGSALDQTMADLEVLVVGDGCTDDSADVVDRISDPRVHWVNLPQNTRHQAGPNNEGARRARGRIVAYLGHDDLWLPRHLERLVAAIDAGAAFAHSGVLQVDPHEDPYVTPWPGWSYTPGAWIPPSSVAVRRSALARAGPWRTPRETGELDPDADLWGRLAAAFGPPARVPEVTSVKLSAAGRPGVYRTRPHAEQEHWLGRIRESPDPEAMVLAAVGQPHEFATPRPRLRLHTRAWRSLRYGLPVRLGVRTTSKARLRRQRRRKGL